MPAPQTIYLFLTILTVQLTYSSCEDLLDEYVRHVELVNNFRRSLHPLLPVRTAQERLTRKRREVFDFDRDDEIQWTHSATLDEDGLVVLRWQPRHLEIIFRVEARTLGYVGVGFSPDGAMEGADIVVGWVDDRTNKAVLLDCHGVPKSQGSAPVRDIIDNYTLMKGVQNDTHTIIEFRRVLDTCDPDDYVLTGDTVRVIWGLHDKDPQHGSEMVYHGEKRGTQSIHLLGPPPVVRPPVEKLRKWDVTLKNFNIPSDMNTVYWCKVFKAPALTEKHHVVGYEPIIGKNHSAMVHHMILHECQLDGVHLELWEKFSKEEGRFCYTNMPLEWEKCLTPLVAWAVGSKGENFPNHVGLPLAAKKNSFFMLEVHFDNPAMRSAVDTSGVRLFHTNNLRENEGGVLMTGVAPSTLHFVPPMQKEYKTAGYCSLDCTREIFPKNGINVVSVLLHSHLAGRKLQLRHIRGGKELPPLAKDDRYDFNYQQSRSLSQDTTILPGDALITECVYSTERRIKPTLGGYSTQEEMCLAFILHYPRTELAGCFSIPPVKYFFESLGVKEFYEKNMTQVEQALLQGSVETEALPVGVSTQKPFEIRPGDELSPEANLRAEMALRNAKEYAIEGEVIQDSLFDKLVIKDPLEFRNKTFTDHLQSIPYNETILTKKIEEYFYKGLHMTFCRKRDDSLAIKESIEKLPDFQEYEDKETQCSYKGRRSSSKASEFSPNVFCGIVVIVASFVH